MNASVLIQNTLAWVFPRVCEICGERSAGPSESFVCSSCRERPRAIQPIREPFCEFCGLPYKGEITTEFTCANCHDLELNFTSARGSTLYAGLVKEIIHRFKYGRQEWYQPFLSSLLIDAAAPILRENPVDLIVPIPLHANKERARGFNQAARLANDLGAAASIPVEVNLLKRVKDTDSQARLDREDRKENVKGAFDYQGKSRLEMARVRLIAEVLTTG